MTDGQRATYEFILQYKREHDGNSPSIREIIDATGAGSTSVVSTRLRRLEREGLIRMPKDKGSRQIEVIGGEWRYAGQGALDSPESGRNYFEVPGVPANV